MTRAERKRRGNEVMTINRRFESQYFNPLLKSLKWKVDEVIDVIRSGGINAGISYLTWDLGNERLSRVVTDLYRSVGLRHASRTWADLRKQQREATKSLSTKGFGFNEVWVQFIENYLRLYFLDKVTYAVNQTTKEKLLQVIANAVDLGYGEDDVIKALQEMSIIKPPGSDPRMLGRSWLRYQAARIVRTETKRAGETGAKAASHTFEFEQQKVWITIKDSRTRGADPEDHADHYHMDGQTVDDDQKFFDSRSGQYLDFPGDPEAAPKDTINCRCTHGYLAKRDENGRLIKKKSRVAVIMPSMNNRRIITI